MNPDLLRAGKKFRRQVAREFRAALRAKRKRWVRFHWPLNSKGAFLYVIGDVARAASMTPDQVRGFIFGGKDLDVESMGRLARALGLKPAASLMEDDRK